MLTEGDIIELQIGHKVYANVPKHFLYENRKGCFELSRGQITIDNELSYLAGRYVVYKTVSEGGGTGHGVHDIYPDGHHVFCEKLEDRTVKVDFYQSGHFTAMIKDIKPVSKALLSWTEQT